LSDTIELCGRQLANPVLNASGTFDALAALRTFGERLRDRFPFAAYVSKTITVARREGNPPPRLWEVPAGLINSIGLPNKGLEEFVVCDLPQLTELLPVPLIVSVMGRTADELCELVDALDGHGSVAMIELNFSCPNVETGLVMGADPAEAGRAVERVRAATGKPLIVKLSPNAPDPAAVAVAAAGAGADALSLINTIKASALHPDTREPALGARAGGLSGPAVRAIALEQVGSVARAVAIPVIGMGGIATGRDAADFLAVGARCVAVGTESFRDAAAGRRIADELSTILKTS